MAKADESVDRTPIDPAASASSDPGPDELAAGTDELEVDEEAEARAAALAKVQDKHASHATSHGMFPGDEYSLASTGDMVTLSGTLIGTNELGVLFQPTGSANMSFHPWAGVKSLTHL